ncbi:hypothetical protein H8Z72_03050 [Xanthomonas citri pv. citri]|uniref:hypothetical protein n=1 Tax=Xanthomonas citri TaxID=346 RepID=UPI000583B029|nr:hypothetical protein [Xanthomonas citri]QRD60775.1 hypothetical protein H8Z74_03060 [Xanthomonas citri pv. citri]QRD65270.1 hypothetical protein H8Z73_03040 [Xanthomonas citri pv. citri]QRD69866.1 hypothetical protein H8Z72_03050 [Xanthomonas citri pv. citri]CEE16658.1 conserved hypothetical protein [Xanthomonas citri pv. citri]CEE52059.1 conserved hypothetical protein [Xanthomonas citri pv. citri]
MVTSDIGCDGERADADADADDYAYAYAYADCARVGAAVTSNSETSRAMITWARM